MLRSIWAALALLASLAACAGTRDPGSAGPGEDEGIGPLVEQAEAHRSRGEHDAAIALYRDALERTPWNERVAQALATTYAERAEAARAGGRRAQAEADLRTAREIAPADPNLAHNLAVVLVERAAREHDLEQAARLRQEARALDPGVAAVVPERDAPLERNLDLAHDLIERGQVDAGVDLLERFRRERPGEVAAARMLAQAYVRRAEASSSQHLFEAAAEDLDRAVALYTETFPRCALPDCKLADVEGAHWNRVVAWLNAERPEPARRALADAAAQGFTFPDLMRALRDLER